eukprot:TRINITY_DN2544_c0_g2_i3.p1 TRINITY_DN2544_c0_g2~~TRINITY_DN2544_c0_g2_i3.p1  ORF type:complete len:448 (+),score=150.59 TRINITY_DN2544_c0_g2_i3:102-1445(+)
MAARERRGSPNFVASMGRLGGAPRAPAGRQVGRGYFRWEVKEDLLHRVRPAVAPRAVRQRLAVEEMKVRQLRHVLAPTAAGDSSDDDLLRAPVPPPPRPRAAARRRGAKAASASSGTPSSLCLTDGSAREDEEGSSDEGEGGSVLTPGRRAPTPGVSNAAWVEANSRQRKTPTPLGTCRQRLQLNLLDAFEERAAQAAMERSQGAQRAPPQPAVAYLFALDAFTSAVARLDSFALRRVHVHLADQPTTSAQSRTLGFLVANVKKMSALPPREGRVLADACALLDVENEKYIPKHAVLAALHHVLQTRRGDTLHRPTLLYFIHMLNFFNPTVAAADVDILRRRFAGHAPPKGAPGDDAESQDHAALARDVLWMRAFAAERGGCAWNIIRQAAETHAAAAPALHGVLQSLRKTVPPPAEPEPADTSLAATEASDATASTQPAPSPPPLQ